MVEGEAANILISPMPLLVVMIPVVGAILAALAGKRTKLRNGIVIGSTLVTLAFVVAMYNPAYRGGIEYSVPFLLDLGLKFRVDLVGLLIALVTAFIWSLSCIYATSYMAHEHAQTRYYVFCLLTEAANLGVLLTKDFFSLFLFFELMAIFSWVLVVHEEDEKAMAAGRLYLYMSIIGGLLLLGGIMLLYAYTGQMNIQPLLDLANKIPSGMRYAIAIAMIVGFGIKAGIFFCHVWLPEAHPIAPTPASALLSGLMIKTGAYGILRTVNTLFAPLAEHGAEAVVKESHATWSMLTTLGYGLIWVGVITMFFGVVNALMSANCKRMLAYHSVSQMGFIVLGLGVAAYLGRDGAMGLAGGLYHIINHALFKSALFLSVGAVYLRTRELDMYKLGGLWRNMPFTCLACFIAVMGISGAPFFNGFASKTLLHHAINEAYEFSGAYTATGRPDITLRIAEVIFLLTCFGTFCSNLKMWLFVFIWKRPERFKDVKPEPATMKIALGALSVAILFVGLRPNWMLERFIGPALPYFGYEPTTHAYHILFNAHGLSGMLRSTIPLLYNPRTLSMLGSTEVLQNIFSCGLVVLGGGMTFVLGYRFGWFHADPPEWVSVKYWYLKLAGGFVVAVSVPGQAISDAVDRAYYALAAGFLVVPRFITVHKRRAAATILDFVGGAAVKEEKTWLTRVYETEDELLEEKIAYVREIVGRTSAEMRKKGVSAAEKQEEIRRAREGALVLAENIAKQKLLILREAIAAMKKAGISYAEQAERLTYIMKLADAMRTISAEAREVRELTDEEINRIMSQSFAESKGLRAPVSKDRYGAEERASLDALQVLRDAVRVVGMKSEEISTAERMKISDIVKETSLRMARLTMKSEEISATERMKISDIMKETSLRMARLTAGSSEERWEAVLSKGVSEYRKAKKASETAERNVVRRIGSWFREMFRISAEILNEERVPWTVQKYVNQEEVAKTRITIRTYTRDLSYNILVAVLLIVIYFIVSYSAFLR